MGEERVGVGREKGVGREEEGKGKGEGGRGEKGRTVLPLTLIEVSRQNVWTQSV